MSKHISVFPFFLLGFNKHELHCLCNCISLLTISNAWRTSLEKATYFGDSSPVSSSPRTPCLNTVSNMPADWYLSANALSFGKKPSCRLMVMDINRKQCDLKDLVLHGKKLTSKSKIDNVLRVFTCWYLSTVNMFVSLILYSAQSSSSSDPEIEVLDGGCLMYSLYGKKRLRQWDKQCVTKCEFYSHNWVMLKPLSRLNDSVNTLLLSFANFGTIIIGQSQNCLGRTFEQIK